MQRITPPAWLPAPEARWLPCRILRELPPQGFLVELSVSGQERSIVVPPGSLKFTGTPPTDGELLVLVVAELPAGDAFGSGHLVELPATPLNGTQRLKVKPEAPKVA